MHLKDISLSIIVPVFNEEKYILEVLKRVNVEKQKYNLEIIVSDDGSTDNTLKLLKNNNHLYDTLIESHVNKGKGFAIINSHH